MEDVLLYAVASLAVILVILGVALIDSGLSRRRHVLDTVVQKLAAALIAGFATFIVGYAIWAWQRARPGRIGRGSPRNTDGNPNGSRSIGGKRRRTSQ